MLVSVARIGKAHGLRGEVALILRTDAPQSRLVDGAEFLATHPGASAGQNRPTTMTVQRIRRSGERWYAAFAGVPDRTAAEALTGTNLELEVDPGDEQDRDPDAWYPDQLIGLRVETTTGREAGTIVRLEHYPAQDVLVIAQPSGVEALLPFVGALVPEVDVAGGWIVVDPPGGLLDVVPADDAAADDRDALADEPGS